MPLSMNKESLQMLSLCFLFIQFLHCIYNSFI